MSAFIDWLNGLFRKDPPMMTGPRPIRFIGGVMDGEVSMLSPNGEGVEPESITNSTPEGKSRYIRFELVPGSAPVYIEESIGVKEIMERLVREWESAPIVNPKEIENEGLRELLRIAFDALCAVHALEWATQEMYGKSLIEKHVILRVNEAIRKMAAHVKAP